MSRRRQQSLVCSFYIAWNAHLSRDASHSKCLVLECCSFRFLPWAIKAGCCYADVTHGVTSTEAAKGTFLFYSWSKSIRRFIFSLYISVFGVFEWRNEQHLTWQEKKPQHFLVRAVQSITRRGRSTPIIWRQFGYRIGRWIISFVRSFTHTCRFVSREIKRVRERERENMHVRVHWKKCPRCTEADLKHQSIVVA